MATKPIGPRVRSDQPPNHHHQPQPYAGFFSFASPWHLAYHRGMAMILSALLLVVPSLNAHGFRYGGLGFTSTVQDVLALYPDATRSEKGKATRYECHSARGHFIVEFAEGQVRSFTVVDLRQGLDVAARRKQILKRFGLPVQEDRQSILWLFPQVRRGVYFKATQNAIYLIVSVMDG